MAYQSWSVIAGEAPTESKWNKLGLNDADFNTRLGKLEASLVTAIDGSTVTFDLSAGLKQYVSLGGDRTLALSNAATGMSFMLILYHNGAVRTPTWWANIDWMFNQAPVCGQGGSGSYDMYGFVKIGASQYLGVVMQEGIY